jgi:hypothetical protein
VPATADVGATALVTARSVWGTSAVTLADEVSFVLTGSGVSVEALAVLVITVPPAVAGLRRAVIVVDADAPGARSPKGHCTAFA